MGTEEANCTNADAMNLSGKRTGFGQNSEKLATAPKGQRFTSESLRSINRGDGICCYLFLYPRISPKPSKAWHDFNKRQGGSDEKNTIL